MAALSVEANQISANSADTSSVSVQKVQVCYITLLLRLHGHAVFRVTVDTGATSSMTSKSFLVRAKITPVRTLHSTRGADKNPIAVQGEVSFSIQFGDTDLPITGLVMENLDCDILAGGPFCKENNIDVFLNADEIYIGSLRIPYGAKPQTTHNIYRTGLSR